MSCITYDSESHYKTFANRKLSGQIDGEQVSGKVDLMIASGQFEPQERTSIYQIFKVLKKLKTIISHLSAEKIGIQASKERKR